ncbi:MAG: hypothetical protein JNL32_00195 [Candidatus Kapabacteria bacterium]|nr:hypothetical protein [Candidatus Kapabacteria bacterium]
MTKLIATDVPDWLINYADRLDWSNPDICNRVRTELQRAAAMLAAKTQNYHTNYYNGSAPEWVLDIVNRIDFINSNSFVLFGIRQKIQHA